MRNIERYFCPFCGVEPKRMEKSQKIKNVKGEVTTPYGVGGKVEAETYPTTNSEAYYDCKGCNNKHVDISSRNIESIPYSEIIKQN